MPNPDFESWRPSQIDREIFRIEQAGEIIDLLGEDRGHSIDDSEIEGVLKLTERMARIGREMSLRFRAPDN